MITACKNESKPMTFSLRLCATFGAEVVFGIVPPSSTVSSKVRVDVDVGEDGTPTK